MDEPLAYATGNSTAAPAQSRSRAPDAHDVARFLAGPPGITVEPAAWTIAGAPTNLIATRTGARTQTGTLLGHPVTIRFVPTTYQWAYGDGTTRTTTTPGTSWNASALQPFTTTPTSHVYTDRGTYQATVTVGFHADYRYADGPWQQITGILPLSSAPTIITVKAVRTVLVARTCTERPTALGCTP